MTTNHTPKGYTEGPWEINNEKNEERHNCILSTTTRNVVCDNIYGRTKEEADANAALIAAAPKQNDTLKLIQHFIHDWRNIARNALAEDRGLTRQGTVELSNTLKNLLDYCEAALSAAEPKAGEDNASG